MLFKLTTEYIELDNLLKVAGIVSSGSEAKQLIRAGLVKVNDTVETRVRKKLRKGDRVFSEEKDLTIT